MSSPGNYRNYNATIKENHPPDQRVKTFLERFNQISFSQRSIPLALLAIMLLAYGLFSPRLGFYQDDWIFIYYASSGGAGGIIEFLNYDGHPLAAWSDILSFALLGFKPIYWQLFSLFWRWLTVTILWLVMIRVWPNHKFQSLIAAIVFSLHPAFTIQSQAVVYSQFWISYFLLGLSFYFTIEAIHRPQKYTTYILLALFFKIIHAFTSEYTWGTEMMRPVLIWFALSGSKHQSFYSRTRETAKIYLPFLVILVIQMVWRGFYYESPVAIRSEPELFNQLLQNPLSTLGLLLSKGIPDIILMLFSSWNRIVEANYFDLSSFFNVYLITLQICTTLIAYFYLNKLLLSSNSAEPNERTWTKQAILTGIAGLLFGMLPALAAGYFMFEKNPPWNTRFIFGPLFGVSLLLSALFYSTLTLQRTRIIFLALLIGALVSWHERNANDFRYSWEKQERLYQQLIWRAPSIQPNTAIIANEEILGYMGDYPTSFAINTIYEGKRTRKIPYWFFAISENFKFSADSLVTGRMLEVERASTIFQGDSQNIIFISYEPEKKQCLWVLRPQDANYKFLPPEMKKAALISNYANIRAEETNHDLYHQIVNENRETWCYFYEKADLARQLEDWKTIVGLWEQAQKAGHRPDNGFEYLPFIEGYARLGNWENAFLLTKNANKITEAMYFILCPLWRSLAEDTPASGTKDNSIFKVDELLGCSQ
jgi:hypothetical protein